MEGRRLCRDRVHDDGESLVVSTRPEKGCEGTGSFLFALVRINDAAVKRVCHGLRLVFVPVIPVIVVDRGREVGALLELRPAPITPMISSR